MKTLLAVVLSAVALSGCIVAPVGPPEPVAVYPHYYGYYGYGPRYYHHRYWR